MSIDAQFFAFVRSTVADEGTMVCEVTEYSPRIPYRGLKRRPDLIVIDCQLPLDVSPSLCRLRRQCLTSTILVARVKSEREGARLLDEGADDVCMHGSPMLPALLNAAVRRVRALNADTRIAFGDLILDREHRRAWSAGLEIALTPKEYDVLNCLFCHAPRSIGRDTLTESVWSAAEAPTPNAIEVYIGYLRRKLSRGSKVAINTVRGIGYALVISTR